MTAETEILLYLLGSLGIIATIIAAASVYNRPLSNDSPADPDSSSADRRDAL